MKPKRRIRRHKESNREQSPFFSGPVTASDQGPTFFQSSASQAKLKVGRVNDPYEKQADATAHAIVNNSGNEIAATSANNLQRKEESLQTLRIRKQEEDEVQTKLQRQAEAEEEDVQMKLQKQEEEEAQTKLQKQEEEAEDLQAKLQKQEEEEAQTKLQKQEEEEVQAKSEVFRKEASPNPTMTTESRISQAKSGGQALPEDVRLEVETQLGASFKKVRIHDDSESHDLCQELNALAFASGHHIFFKKGAYQPYSQEGRFLLIHELTHVIQQRNKTF